MQALRRYYREVWAVDFEFHAPPGERPTPLCLAARELLTGRRLTRWLEGTAPALPPFPTTPDTLVVAYYASTSTRSLSASQVGYLCRVATVSWER